MDELQQRRERNADQDSTRDGGQVVHLAGRDREAHRQDEASDARDDRATAADQAADARDRSADRRDAEAAALDAGVWAARNGHPADSSELHRALRAREDAAYDRELAVDDRGRARRDRKTSKQDRERASQDRGAAWEALAALRLMLNDAEDGAEDMLLIGRAQGIIMQERGLPPTQALLELCVQASQNDKTLAAASHDIVASPPPSGADGDDLG
jgi:hypothetical protein